MRWVRSSIPGSPETNKETLKISEENDSQIGYLRKRIRSQPKLEEFELQTLKKRKYTKHQNKNLEKSDNKENDDKKVIYIKYNKSSPVTVSKLKSNLDSLNNQGILQKNVLLSQKKRTILLNQTNYQKISCGLNSFKNTDFYYQNESCAMDGLLDQSLLNQELGRLDPKEIIYLLLDLIASHKNELGIENQVQFIESISRDLKLTKAKLYETNKKLHSQLCHYVNSSRLLQHYYGIQCNEKYRKVHHSQNSAIWTMRNYAFNEVSQKSEAVAIHPKKYFEEKMNYVKSVDNMNYGSSTVFDYSKYIQQSVCSMKRDIEEICAMQYDRLYDSQYEIYSGVINHIINS